MNATQLNNYRTQIEVADMQEAIETLTYQKQRMGIAFGQARTLAFIDRRLAAARAKLIALVG